MIWDQPGNACMACSLRWMRVGRGSDRCYRWSMIERLQKILSARGIASRRKAEEYIEQGLVKVNGKVATLGQKADPLTDKIEVDGRVIEARREMLYYVINKPHGVVTTNAHMPEDKTVQELLPAKLRGKVFPVGRLDKNSTGLLLLTNDGVLAYRLTHPKFDHEKEYLVETERDITSGQLQKMRDGVMLFGEKTKPTKVLRVGKKEFTIILTEGRNRQIRRMCQKVGSSVHSLRRTRIVTFRDDALKEGELRPLHPEEIAALLRALQIG